MAHHHLRAQVEQLVLSTRTVREHLDDFALRAGHHLGSGTHCSVSLRHFGQGRLAATSSDRAARCDDVEYSTGAGPCLTAMDHLQVVLVRDVLDDARWPSWRERVLAQGFRSAASVPAPVTDDAEIALNLYAESVDPWDRQTLVRADMYAQQIAATVELCLEVARLTRQVSDQRAARAVQEAIDRAVGATMAHHRVSADVALARLRDRARADDVDVSVVAHEVLRTLGAPVGGPPSGTSVPPSSPERPPGAGGGDTRPDRA